MRDWTSSLTVTLLILLNVPALVLTGQPWHSSQVRYQARRRRRRFLLTVLTLTLTFSGCATSAWRLHDASRAKVASGVKETYAKANVLSTIEVEKKNLDSLLEEELKVVRENHRLRVDFALLRIADGAAPMGETYTTGAVERLNELGFDSPKQARLAVRGQKGREVKTEELGDFAQQIKNFGGVDPPPCVVGVPLPNALVLPTNTPQDKREAVENFYGHYRRACDALKAIPPARPGGAVGQAFTAWQAAVAEVAALDRSVDAAQKDVAAKTAAHAAAVTEVKKAVGAPEATKKDLEAKAAAAAKAVESAKDLAGFTDAKSTAAKRVDALVVLLTAAAGGKVDTKDPDVAKAAGVARQIPSLAGELKGVVEGGRAPSVNNLLIELRHQVVLLERAKQLRVFAQQRADLARAQYEALRNEAGLWLRFTDALCSYAVVGADPNAAWPGDTCDDFSVTPGSAPGVSPVTPLTCRLGTTPITKCPLAGSWNAAIANPPNDPATRELYKALAVYLQALAAEGTQMEQTFRLIDVRHREVLATREAALRGWDNLVAVPVDQLDAYYQAGLKPAEIADLLVKALGFAAIAIGVSQ